MKTYTILSIILLFLFTSINTPLDTVVITDEWGYSNLDKIEQIDSIRNMNINFYEKQIDSSIKQIDSVKQEAKKLTKINHIRNYEKENTFFIRMYTPK